MQTKEKLQPKDGFCADRLRQLRKHYGLSQAQMASALSLPKSTYTGWEIEAYVPPVVLYDRLMRVFGLGAAHFVAGIADGPDAPPGYIDVEAGRQLSVEVERLFKEMGLRYQASQIFEIVASLLNGPEPSRAARLADIKTGLIQAKNAQKAK